MLALRRNSVRFENVLAIALLGFLLRLTEVQFRRAPHKCEVCVVGLSIYLSVRMFMTQEQY